MNWPDELRHEPLGSPALDAVAGESATDAATRSLYRAVVTGPQFCRLAASVDVSAPPADDVLVAVVPGAFHREHCHTGADGQRVIELAQSLGCAAERVPLGSFERLETNARRLVDFLDRRRDKRVILVSLSKGSADVKTAVAMAPEAFMTVRVWISFSGMVNGTPLVDWLRRRWWRWLGVRAILACRGQSIQSLVELRCGTGGPLCDWPELPAGLRLIHVLGFPLRRHLRHPWALRGYERLAPLGPNDGGGILLADVLRSPGEFYPVWGADHYLQPTWDMRPLLQSLMRTSLDHANQSATTASAAPASRSIA